MNKSKVAEEIGVLRGQRWSAEDARRVLAAVEESGLPLAAFARKYGLVEQRLGWWRKRLAEWGEPGGADEAQPLGLVRAVVSSSVVELGGCEVVVRLPHGVAIEMADASPQWVVALVRGLCEAAS
jgi:transposase-like protein